MPERRLVLLRHGRTAWNLEDRAQGHSDVPLDDVGHVQAAAAAVVIADQYRVTRLWTSNLARASETASYVGKEAGLVPEPDPRLREYDLGARSGLLRSEFAERFPVEHAAWLAGAEDRPLAPGEESTAQVRTRMAAAIDDCLAALAPGETGVVVTHGACLKVGLFAALGWPWAASRSLKVLGNCRWAELVADPQGPGPRLATYGLGVDFATGGPVG